MNDKTNQLIASLSQDTGAVKPVRLSALISRWVGGFTAYAAVLIACTGVRPDLATAFTRPLFALEILLLMGLVASTALTAALLSFPDGYQRRSMAWLPAPLGAAFLAVLAVAWRTSPAHVPFTGHGPECLSCISLYALLPGAFLFWQMRRMAPTKKGWAGTTAVIAAFSLGALALRLKEQTDSLPHLLQWHYLPMLALALLGLALGKWLLKW